MSVREKLLRRAAACYERAGAPAPAAQCLADVGAWAAAAEQYEMAGDFPAAGRYYAAAEQHANAARCYLRAGRHAAAADEWELAGEPLWAGWALIAARQASGTRRALALLRSARPQHAPHRWLTQLGIAMCSSPSTAAAAAEGAVNQACTELPSLPPPQQLEVETWLVDACDLLDRYDLCAAIYAAGHRAGVKGVEERWRAWAAARLGDGREVPAWPRGGEP
ncbi:hypothetical protein Rhe02_89600 [Rhizocola hellebori]|uniref:Uncharacterized protein n=1 Tax=Rhizocola hellebori TaxID=1392758 RepID=A0A8J3QHB9_9ACTN|nr:hypothetical protein [Rhizocola hellebori]GIH10893.1 hypothetical protein Rhe02_89600 [Rhizocola hellebori]